MKLVTGTKLGPYEVVSPLGAGGMGEVYRARDTRLDRTVAVKILAQHLSSTSERRQRFDREARAISSLSHPHICSLYDVGQQDGIDYLVMEYIEGESLAERLEKGPLPLNQALSYAIQVADALDKAHRAGIVHRDLKPANIMLTRSGAKLLDFGLAKLRANDDGGDFAGQSNLPTEPVGFTGEGTIVGTFQYMAPEQLEAGQVDTRTDIFAFGAVLYEMITGRRAFTGKSRLSLIGAILKDEPPALSTVQPMSPLALDHIVKTCLAKDPDERWQTARDLMRELKWVGSGSDAGTAVPVVIRGKNRERLGWIVAGVLLLALIASLPSAIAYLRQPPVDTRAVRLSIPTPSLTASGSAIAISPDGRRLAFMATDSSGKGRLWIRPLDSLTAQPLQETDGATFPFWSPDSRFIGFFAGGRLKRIDVSGGPPQTLCDASSGRGGTWNRDGVIVFAPDLSSALYRISAAGGESAPLTTLDQASESSHRWPRFLPDGRHFLYLSRQGDRTGIYLGSLDSKGTRRILDTAFNAVYAPPGYLLFVREGALMAQPFDPGKLELTGEPFSVAGQVGLDTRNSSSLFTVSDNGVLVYEGSSEIANSQPAWYDRAGKQISTVGPPGSYLSIGLSPEENSVAVERAEKGNFDIWLIDTARNTPTRFTFDPVWNRGPIWSPDASRIVFSSIRPILSDLYVKPASGSTNEQLLLKTGQSKMPTDWSSDGKLILYTESNSKGKIDIWVLPLDGDRTPMPFLQDDFEKLSAKFSRDGKWVAYSSDESGQPQVYVRPFPGPGGKYQVSNGGGSQPVWRRDGKELFYIGADGKLMALEVRLGSRFEAGDVKPLFDTHIVVSSGVPSGVLASRTNYAVSGDGQRFLINNFTETSAPPITVVLNWTADLKKN
jgi:serine/threonine protein kinase/Tol biopolymer transport system component